MSQTQVFAYTDDDSKTSHEVLDKLSQKACELDFTDDKARLLSALIEREEQGTTALVSGVCMPHARCGAVETPAILISHLTHPVLWKDKDEVELAICLLMPDGDEGMRYLKNLSKIASFLSDADRRCALVEEKDPNVLKQIISSVISEG